MSKTDLPTAPTAAPALALRVALVTQPMGILASVGAARRNVVSIIAEIASRQPMISG